jgi:hypothetical protein
MSASADIERLDTILARLRQVGWKERDAVKEELQTAAEAAADRVAAREHLEGVLKGLPLELRWEVEEVIERLKPPPAPAPAPPPEAEPEADAKADPRQLKMSDLNMVYDDPRGLMLYKHKTLERWFAVQPDPRTGQPQMFELSPAEVKQVQTQLKGSPYWILGA